MVQHWLLLFILGGLGSLWAQDERYYRQILSGELSKMHQGLKEKSIHQFNVSGAAYLIDMNGDGVEESLRAQKRDGVDWIEVKDASKRTVFESKLLAMGVDSVIHKLKLVALSDKLKALIIFLDEGHTSGKKFESTARIFVVSFENNDLSTMKLSPGPHYFHEKEAQREQYFRRDYAVNVVDFNKDGVKEISIQFNHIQRIMEYAGNGEWKRY